MIKIKNITKSFNEKPVLKGISCEFEKGKTSLLIGQTGAGKTVFLKCLLGLHKYDSGKIIFNDRDFKKMNENQKMELKSRIGTVFQGSALFDSMTIEENVMFPLGSDSLITKLIVNDVAGGSGVIVNGLLILTSSIKIDILDKS